MTLLLTLLFIAVLMAAWLAIQSLWLRTDGAEEGADALAGRLGCARGACGCGSKTCERRGAGPDASTAVDGPWAEMPEATEMPRATEPLLASRSGGAQSARSAAAPTSGRPSASRP